MSSPGGTPRSARLIIVVGSVAYLTARTVPLFQARAQLMIEVELKTLKAR